MFLCDAHCHLPSSEFDEFSGGLAVCAACASSADMPRLAAFKKAFPKNVFAAFGVHPKYLGGFNKDVFASFLDNADAVGEIGFDKHSSFDLAFQRNCFEAQAGAAISRNLPLIIHEVGHWNELELSLKRLRPKRFLIHAAKCSAELVKKFEKMGGWFSFGERELKLKSGRDALAAAGKNRILLESDSFPSIEKMEKTYFLASEILNLKEVELCRLIGENFSEFFKNG